MKTSIHDQEQITVKELTRSKHSEIIEEEIKKCVEIKCHGNIVSIELLWDFSELIDLNPKGKFAKVLEESKYIVEWFINTKTRLLDINKIILTGDADKIITKRAENIFISKTYPEDLSRMSGKINSLTNNCLIKTHLLTPDIDAKRYYNKEICIVGFNNDYTVLSFIDFINDDVKLIKIKDSDSLERAVKIVNGFLTLSLNTLGSALNLNSNIYLMFTEKYDLMPIKLLYPKHGYIRLDGKDILYVENVNIANHPHVLALKPYLFRFKDKTKFLNILPLLYKQVKKIILKANPNILKIYEALGILPLTDSKIDLILSKESLTENFFLSIIYNRRNIYIYENMDFDKILENYVIDSLYIGSVDGLLSGINKAFLYDDEIIDVKYEIEYEENGSVKIHEVSSIDKALEMIKKLKNKFEGLTLKIALNSGIVASKHYRLNGTDINNDEAFNMVSNLLTLQDKILRNNIGKKAKIITTMELQVIGLAVDGETFMGFPISLILSMNYTPDSNSLITLWVKNRFYKNL